MYQRKDNLNAITAAGAEKGAVLIGASRGVTTANSTVYYFPIPPEVCSQSDFAVQVAWAAAVAATITIEECTFPDSTAYGSTGWVPLDPPDAYVPVTGSGNSSALATVTAGGSAAGNAIFEMSCVGGKRYRIKADVTTGGLVRVGANEKR